MNCSAQMSTLTDCMLWFYAQQTAQIRKRAPVHLKALSCTNWHVTLPVLAVSIVLDHVVKLKSQKGFHKHTQELIEVSTINRLAKLTRVEGLIADICRII